MNPLHYSHHEGISCDHCMKSNFRGKRYKCLVCPDYDLCSSCYESGTVPAGKRHTSEHPVQCILTRSDYEIYFGGEQNPVEHIQSFTCPICGKMGFTESLLYDHSVQEHSDTFTQVACPICCTMQNVEPGLTIEDFTTHLSIEHRSGRGYDTPQASSLRGRRVPHTNRSVNPTRNRRQITPTAVTMLSNINPNPLLSSLSHDQAGGSNSQIRDLDPITELLSQLRRSQNSLASNSFSNANSNPLHLHLDRNNFRGNTLRQVFERPAAADLMARRHNQTISNQLNQPNLTGASLSYLLMDTSINNNNQVTNAGQIVPNSNNQGSQPSPSSNQFQYLLSTCKEKPKISKELEDALKVDKSLFIQELLISSIENFFEHDLKFRKSTNKLSLDQNEKIDENKVDSKIDDDRGIVDNEVEDKMKDQIRLTEELSPNQINNNSKKEFSKVNSNEINNETGSEKSNENIKQSNNNESSSQPNHELVNNQITKSDNQKVTLSNSNQDTASDNEEKTNDLVASANDERNQNKSKCEQASSNEPKTDEQSTK